MNILTCRNPESDFVQRKISEFKSKPVSNPPASIWRWTYKDAIYYFIPAECCDKFSELYNHEGELICHPDGGYTGRGDNKCPIDILSRDTLNLKRELLWQDERLLR